MNDDWALVVGIDTYPKAAVTKLGGAVRDADRFHEWVTDPLGGGITDETRALLLTSPRQQDDKDPKPVFWQIQKFFTDVMNRIPSGRRLYVFLSGHGISPTGAESLRNAALLMADARAPNRYSNFPGNLWAEGARSTALFQEVVLIMDCCRDVKNTAPVIHHPFGDVTPDSRKGVLLEAYATEWDRKALERELAPNEKHGIFSHSVLKVLRAGKMDGAVFKESVVADLAKTLANDKKPQEAEIKGNPTDAVLGGIVFNEGAESARTPLRVHNSAEPPEVRRLPKGAGALVPVPGVKWEQENGGWVTTLPPGQYQLKLPNWDYALHVFAAVPAEVDAAAVRAGLAVDVPA